MERQKIKRHIENYIGEVHRSIHEPVVERDVGRVTVDAAKAFFLLLPLLNGEKWTDGLNKAAIAVGAVHMAFDVHDTIHLSDATSKKQQLTVLAGDYFSGIHYRLLAAIPELGFIRSLSETIGHINEVKTTIHNQLPDEPHQLIDAISIIEAGCITDFLHTFGFSKYAALAHTALPLLRLEKGSQDGEPVVDVGNDRQVNTVTIDHAIRLLHADMQKVIEAADFLGPDLQQEIRMMTMPQLGKMT